MPEVRSWFWRLAGPCRRQLLLLVFIRILAGVRVQEAYRFSPAPLIFRGVKKEVGWGDELVGGDIKATREGASESANWQSEN